MSNIVVVIVKGPRPFFNRSALFAPGQRTQIDLDDYRDRDEDGEPTGKLPVPGKGKLENLLPADSKAGDAAEVQPQPLAPVAPHAPNPEQPQGLPAGGVISGTGEIVHSTGDGPPVVAVPAGQAQSTESAAAQGQEAAQEKRGSSRGGKK